VGVTIDGVDTFGRDAWIDMFALVVVPGGDPVPVPGAGGLGILNNKLVRFPTLPIVGLGLRLPYPLMGLVNPLLHAGATTLILPLSSTEWAGDASMAAALSRTEGTLWSSCSVVLERGVRCGFVGWREGGLVMGSMSRSKIADEEEWLTPISISISLEGTGR
jgi:hypothetical protein